MNPTDQLQPVQLSVVVPVYNEVDNVVPLHNRAREVLDSIDVDYEIVFVDDGSSDGTPQQLRAIVDADPRVRVIRMRRNFGQTPAMKCGIDHARGSVVVTLDGDLQNDPGRHSPPADEDRRGLRPGDRLAT